ncbi:MAG TPA: DUF2723 domain-containing protein [Gemmatimonadaceae bacterium]|nr:DUF2723 domain-containing protein [Gemmatimonadaceae bacterium]
MSTATYPELDYRPSYLAAGLTAAAVLLLYIVTLAPTTAMWDTSEYMAAAYTLGLPHPPGNPLFVLIGRVFSLLPIPGTTVAVRINILAALASAVSAGLWFLVAERMLAPWLEKRWQRIVGGALATLVGATAFTVWNQSVVNEKVYTVSLVGVALISWLTLRWLDSTDQRRADRLLVLIAYLLGLGYANHMGGFLPGPAVALAAVIARPQTLLRWRLLLVCVAALLFGITPFATQPIRSAHFPAINEGEPTGCLTEYKASCVLDATGRERFRYNFNREQYPKPGLVQRQAPFADQVGMWWLYFKWQWLRDVHMERPGLQAALAVIFLALGLAGGYANWKYDRRTFWYYGPLIFTLTLLLIYFLNFKLGWTQARILGVGADEASEVRDRDYFYLWSFSAWSVWVSLGLVYVWESVAALFGTESVMRGRVARLVPTTRSRLLAAPILALALIPLFANWKSASRAGDTATRDWAIDLLNSVEPYGIIVTGGDNDTFPLWYAQEVEGVRPDVIVAVTSLLNTDWYVRQIIRRPVREYDPAKGPAIYRGRQWRKPSGPPLRMSLQEADQIPPYVQIRQPQVLRKDSLVATVPPQVLTRDQLVVLRMIVDGFPERPIYFSRTAGSYGERLGLEPYLLTQGFAQKLSPAPLTAGKDTVLIPGDGFLDVRRTWSLWNDTYLGTKSIPTLNDWVDRASVNIPYTYLATGALLAEGLGRTGEPQKARQVYDTALQIAHATRLDEVLRAQAAVEEGGTGDTGGDR